jgi:hypothetical protein
MFETVPFEGQRCNADVIEKGGKMIMVENGQQKEGGRRRMMIQKKLFLLEFSLRPIHKYKHTVIYNTAG